MTRREEHASFKAGRDRRLRRSLLGVLQAARAGPRGGMHGRRLKEAAASPLPPDERFESDDHAVALLRDLEGLGFVTLADERTRRGQEYSIDYVFARISAKGSGLLDEAEPPTPMVDDERNLEE